METKRIEYIDIAKGIAIFFVVMGHILANFYNDYRVTLEFGEKNDMLLWRFIYLFHMPLFMFISGFVVFNPFKTYTWNLFGKRLLGYIIPYIIMGLLLVYFYRGAFVFNPMPEGYWYLKTLMQFSVVLFVLQLLFAKVQNNEMRNGLVVITFVSIFYVIKHCYPVNLEYFVDPNHMSMFIYFIIGWLLRRYSSFLKYVINPYALVVTLVCCFINLYMLKSGKYIFAFVAIACILNISNLIADTKLSTSIKKLGGNTGRVYYSFLFIDKYVSNRVISYGI